MDGFSEKPVFDRLKIIVVLLAWANAKENHNLWNELCDYYQALIPSVVLEDDISVRFKILDAVDSYALKRKFIGLNKMVSIKGHWRNQDISSSFFEHYFSHFVFHPLFVGKSKSENASREFAEILTVVVCGNEQFWKNGKGLWWPAGFLLFDLLKNKGSLLEGMEIEGFKIIKAKLCSGLEKYVSDPKTFQKEFTST